MEPRSQRAGGRLRSALADRGAAMELDRRKIAVLLLIGLVAVVVGGVQLWRSQPVAEPLAPPRGSSPLPAAGPAAAPVPVPLPAPSPSASVTVHVAGKVRTPGVVTLPAGARVMDAVSAAGGAKKGVPTDSVNLARRLVDGEQIMVGAKGGVVAAPPPPPGAPVAEAVIDLNTATAEQLDVLPGVGEVLARRIVDYRDSNGGFRSVEQLQEVSGIGDSKYADIKDKVRV